MSEAGRKFAFWLTKAIKVISAREGKSISLIEDELGYSIGREGTGSPISYWRRGFVPSDSNEVRLLAVELTRRGGFTKNECEEFLRAGGFSNVDGLIDQLFRYVTKPDLRISAVEQREFVVGSPIFVAEEFYGRRQDVRRIFNSWSGLTMMHTSVIGPRRSGKTSLLYFLQSQLAWTEYLAGKKSDLLDGTKHPTYCYVQVDFQDPRMQSAPGVLQHILKGMGLLAPENCSPSQFTRIIDEECKWEQRVVIFMDELAAGLAADFPLQFWHCLRSVAMTYARGRISYVVSSHEAPKKIAMDHGKSSPFFNIFSSLQIGRLTRPEALQFISEKAAPIQDPDIDWILTTSDLWPSMLQIICRERWFAIMEGDHTDGWKSKAIQQLKEYEHLYRS